MTKLEQIQSTIEQLTPAEIARLREWLDELNERLFDEKVARDMESGKLDGLLAEVRANHKAGRREEL